MRLLNAYNLGYHNALNSANVEINKELVVRDFFGDSEDDQASKVNEILNLLNEELKENG